MEAQEDDDDCDGDGDDDDDDDDDGGGGGRSPGRECTWSRRSRVGRKPAKTAVTVTARI